MGLLTTPILFPAYFLVPYILSRGQAAVWIIVEQSIKRWPLNYASNGVPTWTPRSLFHGERPCIFMNGSLSLLGSGVIGRVSSPGTLTI